RSIIVQEGTMVTP
nr:immunoglobulin heavy chain junction region [Mus musculus]